MTAITQRRLSNLFSEFRRDQYQLALIYSRIFPLIIGQGATHGSRAKVLFDVFFPTYFGITIKITKLCVINREVVLRVPGNERYVNEV